MTWQSSQIHNEGIKVLGAVRAQNLYSFVNLTQSGMLTGMLRTMQSFPKVTLIAVGKIKKTWIQQGIELYTKRLPELTVIEIKDSNPESEASKILTYVKSGDRLIVLTEEGQSHSSVQLASMVAKADSGSLIFVIGGPDGIAPSLKSQAHHLLSLSAMTFPHELARLMLIEQLYRAKAINQNTNYHR
ncbi:MAG: 23S rRNA (pseudouridine(1915)-N(3))-methyltransferase RlmH [Leptolyngbyaceae bacterium]|nr:23S rRNA (pseudouridine(1915)-N(3))-methyltransferase RlmH [Leptolyngbyaceae bacterium]